MALPDRLHHSRILPPGGDKRGERRGLSDAPTMLTSHECSETTAVLHSFADVRRARSEEEGEIVKARPSEKDEDGG